MHTSLRYKRKELFILIAMFWVYVLVIIAFYAFVVGRVVNKSSTSSVINDSGAKQNTSAPLNAPQTGKSD